MDEDLKFEDINVKKLLSARALELKNLEEECKSKLTKLSMQRLPRFMRRRAASHNYKRIPKQLRHAWKKKFEATSVDKAKKRKQRQKHLNVDTLTKNRRKRNAKEDRFLLHLWFVKRFKMTSLWGYEIPLHNCFKNRRNLYRMSKHGVVYYYLADARCIELSYEESNLSLVISKLAEITDCTIKFEEGKETCVILYQKQNSLNVPLGPVRCSLSQNFCRIWTHISVYETILKSLTNVFENTECSVIYRKFHFERFRLVGPKSHDVIQEHICPNVKTTLESAFSPATVYSVCELNEQSTLVSGITSNSKITIINTSINRRECIDVICCSSIAKDYWKKLIQNRGHLVGGLENMKSLALDASCLYFPLSGFVDVTRCSKWTDLVSSDSYFVIREKAILKHLENGDTSAIGLTDAVLKNALVVVDIFSKNHGVPEEEDFVCTPSDEDLLKFMSSQGESNIEEKFYGPTEIKRLKFCHLPQNSCREVIGYVEAGQFSLEHGRGQGIATVTYFGLLKLIDLKRKTGNADVLVLFRSMKSPHFRFAQVTLNKQQLL